MEKGLKPVWIVCEKEEKNLGLNGCFPIILLKLKPEDENKIIQLM